MTFEKVRLNQTLKAGKNIWLKGTVITEPVPSEIVQEIMAKTGTVEVLSVKEPEPLLIPKESDKPSTVTTMGKSSQALLRPEELPEKKEPAPKKAARKAARKKTTRRKKLLKK